MKNNKQYYVYRIWNTVNNKSYIGQTSNPKHRFYRCHRRNYKLIADIERYGEAAFKSVVLASTPDEKFAQALEEHFVDQFDSIRNGYNIARCFRIPVGLHRTEAANDKRRQAISRTVWMYDPSTGQSTRANPARAEELEAHGWKRGRVCDKNPYMKGSARNKLFGVNIPDGTGDYFKAAQ